MKEFYEKLLVEHGDSPKTLGWSKDGQHDRFEVAYDIGIDKTDSVADVGCGLGHLVNYLVDRNWSGKYYGVDWSELLVKKAKDLHAGDSLSHFEVMNVFDEGAHVPKADWVVASGLLNLEMPKLESDNETETVNELMMWELMRRCFIACKRGVVVNMLSSLAPLQREGRHYYQPSSMFQLALQVTKKVTLRHDYRDNDFTLYLYR